MRKAALVRRHVTAVAGRVLLTAVLTSPIVDLSRLDEARGRLNRQQWIRVAIVEKLQREGNS
jgi:hypothetical protein